MSNNRVRWDGLAEFRAALRSLPEDLAHESAVIVQAHAEDAERRIEQAYPEGPTGNLRRGVTKQREVSRFGARVTVRSRAPHAYIFERGTSERRTAQGYNRGRMPEAPQHQRMLPIVIAARRRMQRALVDLVRRAGFQVEQPA